MGGLGAESTIKETPRDQEVCADGQDSCLRGSCILPFLALGCIDFKRRLMGKQGAEKRMADST